MKTLFRYNWQVRDDWFAWCENVPEEELLKNRVGGVGSILYTLHHIVDVERSWIHCMKTGEDIAEPPFEDYATAAKLKALSDEFHREVEPFVMSWTDDMESQSVTLPNPDGTAATFKLGEIMRHMIAHEIHHIGQLSVWSRELGRQPVSANLIFRGLYE